MQPARDIIGNMQLEQLERELERRLSYDLPLDGIEDKIAELQNKLTPAHTQPGGDAQ